MALKSLILAGGFGRRLRTTLKKFPKSMAPVGKKPFLEYLIMQLIKYKIQDVVLCIGYLGKQIKEYFGDGSRWGIRILYSEEKKALGTGGAIKLASRFIENETFLVMNGDSFLDSDLNAMIAFHNNHRALATIAVVQVEDTSRFGKVEINRRGEIERFVEKNTSGPGIINGGIYVFNHKMLERIPDAPVSLENEVLPHLINQGLFGMLVKGLFIDIGVPKDYKWLKENSYKLLNIITP
ncbi:MAG: nucleotidyltransferase family protein [Candidatus Helarchaeota archaeon]